LHCCRASAALALSVGEVKPSAWGIFPGLKEMDMTPLRQQMLDAMAVRGLAARAQESYVDSLGRMARYFKRSLAVLTAQDMGRCCAVATQAQSACRTGWGEPAKGQRLQPRCGLARIPALHRRSRIERMRRLPSIQSPIPTETHPLTSGFVQYGLPAACCAQRCGQRSAAADKR
jgi:hypothetical protein